MAGTKIPERSQVYRNHHLDSTRWDGFEARDDDIIITTAYKAGTTWTQRIVAALVLGPPPLYAGMGEISPWIDARWMGPVEPVLAGVEAQEHRRFVKSYLAADGLRYFPQAKYIVVGRDTRDVFMSLFQSLLRLYRPDLHGVDNGRWRGVLTDDDLAMYETAASTLDPNLRQWLEGGRHATNIA